MKPDPPVRPDKRCALPGCDKPLQQITPRHWRYGGAAVELDPFCSRPCCEEWRKGAEIAK